MIRKILRGYDPRLKQVCNPILINDTADKARALEIAQDLLDTLKATPRGAALAAPQIAFNDRIIAIHYGEHLELIMINPIIVKAAGRMKHNEECLSFPRLFKRKVRKQSVVVEYYDQQFEKRAIFLSGLDAVIAQHEIDHLDGKILTDD